MAFADVSTHFDSFLKTTNSRIRKFVVCDNLKPAKNVTTHIICHKTKIKLRVKNLKQIKDSSRLLFIFTFYRLAFAAETPKAETSNTRASIGFGCSNAHVTQMRIDYWPYLCDSTPGVYLNLCGGIPSQL